MDWQDDGIIVSVRPHGEASAIVHLLTREHGLCAGYVRGGQGKSMRGMLQVGNGVYARWFSRNDDSLGSYTLEMTDAASITAWHDPVKLRTLQSACAVIHHSLPERQHIGGMYDGLRALLDTFDSDFWSQAHILWEMQVLRALGFGIDLSRCAVTGQNDNLAYVSPRTGKAVSRDGAGEYADRMLKIPSFLLGQNDNSPDAIADGLKMTGYFLEKHVFGSLNKPVPDVRVKLFEGYLPVSMCTMVEDENV